MFRSLRRVLRRALTSRTRTARAAQNPSDLESGSQALVLRCAEPALSGSAAVAMFEDTAIPLAAGMDVNTAEGFLFDTIAFPGIVRLIATLQDGVIRHFLIEKGLKLLLNAHGIEVIFLLEHTGCAERASKLGVPESFVEDGNRIEETLTTASIRLMQDLRSIEGLRIVALVAVVSDHHDSRRCCERVVTLPDFLDDNALRVHQEGVIADKKPIAA